MRLWNPTAAANWSIVFSPIFGAWIHAKNWRELGKEDEAKKSMTFVYSYILLYVLMLILPIPDALTRIIGIAAIAIWYFSHAKTQIKHVENGISYEKKSWTLALLSGIAGMIIFFTAAFAVGELSQPSIQETLEKESVTVVTQILKDQTTLKTSCRKVIITKSLPNKTYQAIAQLENGNTLDITIKVKGEQFYVEFPTP